MNKAKSKTSKKIIGAAIAVFILCSVLLLTPGQFDLSKIFAADYDTVVYTKAGDYTIKDDFTTVDVRQMQKYGDKSFMIDPNVTYVVFLGSGDFIDSFKIAVALRSKPLLIVLNNMNYRAPVKMNALTINNSADTDISFLGNCKLTGGWRTEFNDTDLMYNYLGSNAIYSYFGNVNIFTDVSSASLTLTGGQGMFGLLGGCGFLGDTVHLYSPCSIIGGKGGIGGSGTDGAASTSHYSKGGDGGEGQKGGDGGVAVDSREVHIHCKGINLIGGAGGDGGKGGAGGKGHIGKNGALFVSPIAGTDGGNGGKGGDAGLPGNFYDGLLYPANHDEPGYLKYIIIKHDGEIFLPTVSEGELSAVGGTGGRGGDGGSASLNMYGERKDNPGEGGIGGKGGRYKTNQGFQNAPSGANGNRGK